MKKDLTFHLHGIEEDYFDFIKGFFVSYIETLDPNVFTIAHLFEDFDDSSATLYLSFGKSYFEKEFIDD